MAIEKIDSELCNGCGLCVNACQADVICLDKQKKKAFIKYPGDCMACMSCAQDCPQQAITITPTKQQIVLSLWGIGA